MTRLLTVFIAIFTLSVGGLVAEAAPPRQEPLEFTGPALVEPQGERLYVVTGQSDGDRQTAVVSTSDGSVLSTYPVAGPMSLDAARGRLYVSTSAGVSALDIASGQTVHTFPAVPVKTGWGSGDYLPPIVIEATGEVLVIDGPQATVFAAASTAPVRTLPFTAEGFTDSAGLPLTPQLIAYDAARGILYGAFQVHSQASSGIGGSFSAYEVYGLDVKSGQPSSELEAVNLWQMTVDEQTGNLLVNAGGNAMLWPGSGDWSAQLQGAMLASDQQFQIDTASRRVYAKVAEGPLLTLDLDTLNLLGLAHLGESDRLLALDRSAGRIYLLTSDGKLSSMPVSSIGNSFSVTAGDGTSPQRPVRSITVLPDGRLAAEWDDLTVGLSSDGGTHWSEKIAGSYALAVSPQFDSDRTLLIALDRLGVFRSEDAGTTWHISSSGLRSLSIDWIEFSPAYAVDRTVYLYTRAGVNPLGYPRPGDLYHSSDGGRTWRVLPSRNNGMEDITVSDSSDNTYVLTAVQSTGAAPGPGTFVASSDGGQTWTTQGITPAFPVQGGLALAPLYGKWGVGFIFGSDGVLYRSGDAGQTWSAVLTGAPPDIYWGFSDSYAQIAIAPDAEEDRPVLLVLSWGESADDQLEHKRALFVSADGGLTWQRAIAPGGTVPTAIAVSDGFVASGLLYIGLPNGGVSAIRYDELQLEP